MSNTAIIKKLLTYSQKKLARNKQSSLIQKFIKQYYTYSSAEDLGQRSMENLFGAALSHWELMYQRTPGQYKRRVFNPQLATDGWESSHTILQFILDDQPFLVDTICTEIDRQGLTVHFLVHLGGIKIARNGKHAITDIFSPDVRVDHTISEAPIYIEIDRQTDPAVLADLEHNLDRVIKDARAAVADWGKMTAQINTTLIELQQHGSPLTAEEIAESSDFLRWLLNGHFTFLGYREYDRIQKDGKLALCLVDKSGLGVLRETERSKKIRYYDDLAPEAQRLSLSKQLLVLAKTNTRSTVHGNRYTDFISIKRFNTEGDIIGERWFVGLYTSIIFNESPRSFPLVGRKIAAVLARSGLPPQGHAYKALVHILDSLPREDLFHASLKQLSDLAMGILQLQERRCIRLFTRPDIFGRFISCLVYVPRDEFNMNISQRMQAVLAESFSALEISYTTFFSDSVLARIHFMVRIDPHQPPHYNTKHIEQKLIEVGRSWRAKLHTQLVSHFGEEKGNLCLRRYSRAFPAAYRENFSAADAIVDIKKIEQLHDTNDLGMHVYVPASTVSEPAIRFKLYHLGSTIPLSDAIPILEKMGLRVIGEQPYTLTLPGGNHAWINDFNLRYSGSNISNLETLSEVFQDAFRAIWHGQAEHDGFNGLVLSAQLTWRQVALLRCYAKYLKQIGSAFGQEYIEAALCKNPHLSTLLVQLFEEKFALRRLAENDLSEQQQEVIVDAIKRGLNQVTSLDEDSIIREFLQVIRATIRTNYFQSNSDGQQKSSISIKLNPANIRNLPLPRPMYEVFVYAPHFEGIHLRAGKVARGGLRWSDRREDFRREVLGLMKAQQVKNSIIVPAGAKGGFVPKLIPADADRDTIQKEGVRCYQDFIRGLLDITDNLKANQVIHPVDTVCYDGDDPYFVVAADKGTATFSDIANAIAKHYNFWLGDAFASGGSAGYDHKKIAITARGAWESVKRHFRELEIDINKPFTAVGIGDMSGDVFGNGMLLSDQIKLIAVLSGSHIFIDPNPNPAISFKERQRLFNLPRSTWEDYNPKLISKGGGVYKRSLKSIKLSNEAMAVLDINKKSLTPNELIKAILRAPVDLLWNGGIGTFIKSSHESHLDVGDRANDGLRVDGKSLRCRVVAEGGNLGVTQLGRIEYDMHGGRINTDFIDNSAGVDCSDHEVNIKVLLNDRVAHKQMSEKQRNALLADMTDEVAQLVLYNNYQQARVVSNATRQSAKYINAYAQFLKGMEKQGKIDRKIEFLPTDEQIAIRRAHEQGLTRPEIAVLMAYSKTILKSEILASDLVHDTNLNRYVELAFPARLAKAPYAKLMAHHRLRGEIMTTQLSSLLINHLGITFVYRMCSETGAPLASLVRAYVITLEIFNLLPLLENISRLPIPPTLDIELTQHLRRLMRRSIRWLLRSQRDLSIKSNVVLFTNSIKELEANLPRLLPADEKEQLDQKASVWTDIGIPAPIATRVASAPALFSLLNIIKIAHNCHGNLQQVASLYFGLETRLDLEKLRDTINNFPIDSHWMALAGSAAKGDLDAQQRALTLNVFKLNKKIRQPVDSLDAWFEKHAHPIQHWKAVFAEMRGSNALEYSMLVVVMRELGDLVAATSSYG
jgi:glutamate dehydrogenase